MKLAADAFATMDTLLVRAMIVKLAGSAVVSQKAKELHEMIESGLISPKDAEVFEKRIEEEAEGLYLANIARHIAHDMGDETCARAAFRVSRRAARAERPRRAPRGLAQSAAREASAPASSCRARQVQRLRFHEPGEPPRPCEVDADDQDRDGAAGAAQAHALAQGDAQDDAVRRD